MAVNLTTLSRDTPIPIPQQLRVNTLMVTICNSIMYSDIFETDHGHMKDQEKNHR